MMPHLRLRLAAVSVALTIVYSMLAVTDPAVATPLGFVYAAVLVALYLVCVKLRNQP